eukprot:CAMPEP_0119311220 /NCGR_PEP_ID=MMETSP1333-20130426/21979_1 /TAXON_ID=418940 /ORGANISM="Scyphosphaera apsteinii, Strain RCC1455" /LENGTH=208 /DNA_ID=CAMNT_0007315549 /DNA_START=62 /DNA_END=688 /DNA_ORIENTATION=-
MTGPVGPPTAQQAQQQEDVATGLSPADKGALDRWVEAKRSRDFATADRIRSELEAKGIKAEVVRPHVWEPPRADRWHGHHPGSGAIPLPQGMPPGRTMPSYGSREGEPKLPPGIDPSVGDWPCPSCGNWNWARRKECNQCHVAKDGMMKVNGSDSGTKRLGSGGGFKEFDQEEDARRKRRVMESHMETKQRKAEKKKCEACRRYSCIC